MGFFDLLISNYIQSLKPLFDSFESHGISIFLLLRFRHQDPAGTIDLIVMPVSSWRGVSPYGRE